MKVRVLVSIPRKGKPKKGEAQPANIQFIWIELPDEVWHKLCDKYG